MQTTTDEKRHRHYFTVQ